MPFAQFLRDRRANVAITFAVSLLPLLAFVGAAIDYSRAGSIKASMQGAMDAASLSAAKNASTMTAAQLQTTTTNIFLANFNRPEAQNVSITATYTQSSGLLSVNGTVTVPMYFWKFLGLKNVVLNVSTQVTAAGQEGVELALVLDNTGSMVCGDAGYTTGSCTQGTSHLSSLQTASKDIVQTLFNGATDKTKMKIAVVPFVTTANPGSKVANNYVPSMTDVNGNKLYNDSGKTPTYDPNTANTTNWKGCVVESKTMVTAGYDTTEPAGGWTGPWVPYYWPSAGDYNDSTKSTNSPSNGYSGIPDYNSWMTGKVGSNPNVNVAYANGGDLSSACFPNSHGPNNGCPTPITELSTDLTTVTNSINALQPWCASGTMIHLGLMWGWRALSPNPPFSDGQPYNATGWIKVVVLVTDGESELVPDCDNPNGQMDCSNDALGSNFPSGPPGLNPPQTQLTGEGRVPDGLLGTPNSIYNSGSKTGALTTMRSRLATVCTNMKNKGIIIYTVGYGPAAANGADASTLQACAGGGSGSSTGQYFSAPSGASLDTVFQSIATSIGHLHISK